MRAFFHSAKFRRHGVDAVHVQEPADSDRL